MPFRSEKAEVRLAACDAELDPVPGVCLSYLYLYLCLQNRQPENESVRTAPGFTVHPNHLYGVARVFVGQPSNEAPPLLAVDGSVGSSARQLSGVVADE
jgi:hypothetical protein